MKKVLVFGTFDALHPGHISFFSQAKKRGDYLVVVIARDSVVEKIKNHKTFKKEKERLRQVKALKLANEVLLGSKSDPYKIIEKIKPSIIVLGYDQKSFTKGLSRELKKRGLTAKIYRAKSYYPRRFHSKIIYSKKLAQ